MITENVSTLKIHKLTQEQYDRELAAGNIDETALYLTPDSGIHIASKEIAGVVKPGDFKVEEDGTVWMIKTVTGESLVLDDSVAGGLKIDRICGGSKQEKTSGNQLIDVSVLSPQTHEGITFEPQTDGGIKISGTAINQVDFYLVGTVSATAPISGAVNGTCYVKFKETPKSCKARYIHSTDSLSSKDIVDSTTVAYADSCKLLLRVAAGTTVNETVYIMFSNTDAPYEPYTGNIPSPNPKYPQPIVSAGQMLVDGVVTDVGISKKLTGKNLLKNTATSQTINGVTFTVNEDGSIIANGTTTKDCFADLYIYGTLNDVGNYLFIPKGSRLIADKPYVAREKTAGAVIGVTKINQLLSERDCYFYGFFFRVLTDTTVNNLVTYPMIVSEEATDDTYEPYTEQTLTLNKVLRGIPVTDASLATYTDANGQMWCADYIDAERGVLVQKFTEVVFDGSDDEGWSLNNESRKIFATKLLKNAMPPVANKNKANILCDSLITYPYYHSGDSGTNELYAVSDGISLCSVGTLYVRMNSVIEIVDLASFKVHLAENPITVIYELATPIETPLTDEEIIALHQLKTYQGVTHIFGSNDPDATMIFKYSSSEIGGVTLENSNLHAVNEVLRRQMLTHSDVVDNLTSTDTDVPLSANQGRVLKNELDDLKDEIPDVLPINKGGTGATDAAGALTNLGLTATAAELNHMDGVTSNVQTQINTLNNSLNKFLIVNKQEFEVTDTLTVNNVKEKTFDITNVEGYTAIGVIGKESTNGYMSITKAFINTAHQLYLCIVNCGSSSMAGGTYKFDILYIRNA